MTKPPLSDPIAIRLPENMLSQIMGIAQTCDRSRSWVIVRALKLYLASEGADILAVSAGRNEAEAGVTEDMDQVLREVSELIGRRVA
jgi:predicted transcriptional regulator